VAVITVAVLPLAGAKASLDINLRPLLEVAFDHSDQPVAIDNDIMPLGALLALAGHAVLPAFGGRNADIRDLSAVLERLDFGVRAQIADENNLVDAASHRRSAPLECWRISRVRRRRPSSK